MPSDLRKPVDFWMIRRSSMRHTFGEVRRYADGRVKPHQGWDLWGRTGDVVYAIADGKIEFCEDRGAYGLQICLAFTAMGQSLWAFYAHLQSSFVYRGITVHKGEMIGTIGESGNAKGQSEEDRHLHFEIRTTPRPGLGLPGRISPGKLFGPPPL